MKPKLRLMWLIISILYIGGIFMLSLRPVHGEYSIAKAILHNFLHVPLYGGLAFFLIITLRHFLSGLYVYFSTFIIGISIALADEFIQSFIPGRTVSKMDLLLDLIGICLVVVFIKYLQSKKGKTEKAGK